MPTFFDDKKSFADVPVTEQGVDTTSFLQACDGLCALFNHFGTAFAAVKQDINGNITKVRARQTSHPAVSGTLEKLVENEGKEKERPATEGLLWLLRGLSFTCIGLQNLQGNKDVELATAFGNAYTDTLKPFHGILVKGLFGVAMKACPYRKDFYEKLGSPPEKVDEDMGKWLVGLDTIVKHLVAFYTKKDNKSPLKP